MAKEKRERVVLWTPVGRLSYPFLARVDSGRTYSDDAYKTDLLIYKPTWKEQGKALSDAVLKVGKEAFGSKFKLTGGDWHIPFKDMDTDDSIQDERQKGAILIRAKSKPTKKGPAVKPIIIGPRKGDDGKFAALSPEEIQAIKGGDWARLRVSVYAYTQKEGGVTFALSAVQFWKTGEAFGQGVEAIFNTAEELEVEMEEADEMEDSQDSEEGDEIFGA